MLLLFLIVVTSFAIYVMEPEERTGVLRRIVSTIKRARNILVRVPVDRGPFGQALRSRTRWASLSLAFAALIVLTFFRLILGDGALADPETLIHAGGNFGPRTTNGEWWRLVWAAFVHAGTLHLLVNVIALVQVGLILERLVGHVTFAAVFVSSAIFSSLTSLYAYPMGVHVGASGAVFGIYGLLVATAFWGMLRRSSLTVPLMTVARLGPAALVFVLYNVLAGSPGSEPELTGLITGLAVGGFLTRDVSVRKPQLRLCAAALATTLAIALMAGFPLRGVADVRPEIVRIVALEGRIAAAYEAAVKQFKLGAIKAEALAQIIDRTIVPELHAAQGRLKAFDPDKVPQQDQPLVADASEYLRLRDESWRLRAEALRKANMAALRKADRSEWASLQALEKIKPRMEPE
jgi:rhomboid protease GluP